MASWYIIPCLYKNISSNFSFRDSWLRYKADMYDWQWEPSYSFDGNLLRNNDYVDFFEDPPSQIMTTAVTPINPNDSINLSWYPVNATDKFFICMYFAETEILKSNQTREFNIYLNGDFTNGPLSMEYNSTTTAYIYGPEEGAPSYTLTVKRTKNSTLPPIINAFEIYSYKQQPQRQTDDRDGQYRICLLIDIKIAKFYYYFASLNSFLFSHNGYY